MGRRGVVFLWRERCTTSATFFGQISAKLPNNTCPGGGSRQMVSYSRKVSTKGSILPKTPLLAYPMCDQPTGHGKRSATLTLFPSPTGQPTYVPFLGDFCWGMYRLPPIYLRRCPYQQWACLDGDTVAPPAERRDTTQYAYNFFKHHSSGGATIGYVRLGSLICSRIIIYCTFSSFNL